MDHIHQVDVQWSQIEMVFLVDVNAEAVLRKSGFSSLVDVDWVCTLLSSIVLAKAHVT